MQKPPAVSRYRTPFQLKYLAELANRPDFVRYVGVDVSEDEEPNPLGIIEYRGPVCFLFITTDSRLHGHLVGPDELIGMHTATDPL